MSRLYHYVGPAKILEASRSSDPGLVIGTREQLLCWLKDHANDTNSDGSISATFIIDKSEKLRLSPRRYEHIACASRESVLGAGEMSFIANGEIIDVNNYSTGFCPEPESWISCAAALDRIGIMHPNEFTRKIIFRRCPECTERNIVKDNWYVCDLCGSELPIRWNFE